MEELTLKDFPRTLKRHGSYRIHAMDQRDGYYPVTFTHRGETIQVSSASHPEDFMTHVDESEEALREQLAGLRADLG